MAFYQKYRPRTLDELVGQEFVRHTLHAAIKSNQVAHAYLFFGSRGTGKTSTARILAKALNCQKPRESGDPCNECDFCKSADAGNFVDLIEIDGASNRKIEHARALIERINFAPSLGTRKVYIIDEVHMLTKEAFNALLKTIEEPPEHAFFLLATTELQKVPETIRSRCQVFTFHRFTPEQIADRLQEIAEKENIIATRDALVMIAKKATGGLRDAIGLFEQASADGNVTVEHLEQELGIASHVQMERFFQLLSADNTAAAIDFVGEISSEGLSLTDFLEQFLGYLREQMLESALSSEPKTEQTAWLLKIIDRFDHARRGLRDAPIPTLPIEIAIVQITKIDNAPEGVEIKKTDLPLSTKEPQIPPTPKVEPKPEPVIETKPETSPEASPPVPVIETPPAPVVETPPPPPSPEPVAETPPPSPKPEPTPLASTPSGELNKENVKQQWGTVLEKLGAPIMKAILGQARIMNAENNIITLEFAADSWKQQAEEQNRYTALLETVQEIFGSEVKIEFQVKGVPLQPIEKPTTNNADEKPVTDPSIIAEIFGTKK
jgi:DNA polymerase-3 subunit gamma/tau